MYPYPTTDTGINNIIFLLDYYFQANLKHYAIYMYASLYFTRQKLCTYFQKKDIMVIFAPSTSHKSVSLIEKSNDMLQ